MSLGSVSRMYSLMKLNDQITISKQFDILPEYLESYLMHITLVRNICAHNNILFNYKSRNSLPQKEKRTKKIYLDLNIEIDSKTGRFRNGVSDFLAIIIIMFRILNNNDYNIFYSKLSSLLKTLNKKIPTEKYNIILFEMGIVPNWTELKVKK